MKKKMRKFAEGGYETAEGENEMISKDPGIRERARKFIEDGSPEQDTGEKPVTVTKTKTKTSVTASKPKADDSSEKERIESIGKKQALERVYPEEMIGGGAGKLLQMAGKKLSSKIAADRTAKEVAEKAAKNTTRKSEEGFSPAEALAAREKLKTDELIKKAQKQTRIPKNISKAEQEARKERYLSTGPMEDAFGTGSQFKRGFKSGGSVKSSASRRADGCAIRGKTRA
jgi:hypothetical protein